MKKYAIIIGENNKETSRKVQEALRAVGICLKYSKFDLDGSSVIIVENNCYSVLGFLEPNKKGFHHHPEVTTFLNPSYVIAHAAELDGARKPWEVAPEGYRLVTGEEEIAYIKPNIYMRFCKPTKTWKHCPPDVTWNNPLGYSQFAVPADFTFAPIEPEIEVDGKMYKVSELNKLIEAAKPIK